MGLPLEFFFTSISPHLDETRILTATTQVKKEKCFVATPEKELHEKMSREAS
jgi:hypothetical protein